MANKEAFRSVLIFGGAGFIGSNWARRLLETTQAQVHVYDSLARPGSRHNLEGLRKLAARSGRLQFTLADVRDPVKVQRAVEPATEIYNFAAQVAVTTSIADPRLDFEVNLGGTFNILEAARACGRQPFLLFTSTNKVYGEFSRGRARLEGKRYLIPESATGISELQSLDFHSPYGCSKGAADQYVHDYARVYSLPTVVFRMSCIAGPGQFGNEDQGWVAHFLYSAMLGATVTIYGDGRQVRDVLAVGDLLDAFECARAHQSATAGQIYNVGGGPGNAISLLELVERIAELTGIRLDCEFERPRLGDQLVYVTDHSKLTRDTGWRPRTSVGEILKSLQRWFGDNRAILAGIRKASAQLVVAHTPPAPGMEQVA
jgi:CDP-paratose 2-epimerase